MASRTYTFGHRKNGPILQDHFEMLGLLSPVIGHSGIGGKIPNSFKKGWSVLLGLIGLLHYRKVGIHAILHINSSLHRNPKHAIIPLQKRKKVRKKTFMIGDLLSLGNISDRHLLEYIESINRLEFLENQITGKMATENPLRMLM